MTCCAQAGIASIATNRHINKRFISNNMFFPLQSYEKILNIDTISDYFCNFATVFQQVNHRCTNQDST